MKAVALLLACACFTACGENSDQKAAKETVNRFYAALEAHDAKTACSLISPGVAQAMLHGLGTSGPCIAGLDRVFRHAEAGFFDDGPTVEATLVKGDQATVTVQRGPLRRKIGLTHTGDKWLITVAPNFK